jgi:hypothetical protein
MATTSQNKYLTEPAYGDSPWYNQLNTNFTIIDAVMGASQTATITASNTTTLTVNTTGTGTAQSMRILVSGALTAGQTATLQFPSAGGSGVGYLGGMWIVDIPAGVLASTATLVLSSAGGGTTQTITANGKYLVFTDGTNIYFADSGTPGITTYPTLTVSGSFVAKGATSGQVSIAAPAIAGTNTVTLPAVTDTLAGISATQTLNNKRIDPRVFSTTSGTSVTPDISSYDIYAWTALAAGLTLNAPTGSPANGDKLIFRIKDNGTPQNLTWTTTTGAYRAVGVTLPTTTTTSKILYVGCIYNGAENYWDVIALSQQA